jgi:starch-binding outer membrane protein, SusD/RagB family
MKNYKYKILFRVLFFTSIVLSFSCTKLDKKSYTEILTSDLNPTDDDIAAITAAAYSEWRVLLLEWNGLWRAQEAVADEVVVPERPNGWVDGGIYKRMHQHTWVASDDIVYETWYRGYLGVASCNRIIYQINSGYLPLTTTKKTVLAELKVLRASYYYVLCDLYGNVPIDTLYNVETGYVPTQSTRKEVYDFIVKEITENMPYLSRDNDGVTYGRFNVWAAHTLLAKMYLNAEVYTGIAAWADCISQCDSLLNSNVGFALESDQKNVFITENENSSEFILGLAIDATYTSDWNQFDIHMQTLQPANQATYELTATPWGGMCAIPQFINTFDASDKRFTNNFIMGQQYSYAGDSLVCTLGALVSKPLAYVNSVPNIDSTQEIHGYRFGKFEIALGSSNILNNDYPLFRFADIYMMKAECLLRTGQADAAAVLVSKVRARAFDDATKATVTGAQLQQGSSYDYGYRDDTNSTEEGGSDITYGRFLDELGWEFNQEGRRRQDMIRFGVFTTKSWFSHSPNGSYRILFPIPTTALSTNSNLTQNTGY